MPNTCSDSWRQVLDPQENRLEFEGKKNNTNTDLKIFFNAKLFGSKKERYRLFRFLYLIRTFLQVKHLKIGSDVRKRDEELWELFPNVDGQPLFGKVLPKKRESPEPCLTLSACQ